MPYIEPTPADLRQRYPAFADATAIPDDTVQYWLTDAGDNVDQALWSMTDYAKAKIALAAHNMIRNGVPGVAATDSGAIAQLAAAGVTDFQSGGREGFRASLSPDAVKQAISGEYSSTQPGQDYLRLVKRNISGIRTTSAGQTPPCAPFPVGLLPYNLGYGR